MSFIPVCAIDDVKPESALAVEVDGVEVAIVHSSGRFYAIADECSHAAIPLSEGDVGDGEIECYLHGSRFDLATGEPIGLPAIDPVAVYACQVSGNDVLIDVSTPLPSASGGDGPPGPSQPLISKES